MDRRRRWIGRGSVVALAIAAGACSSSTGVGEATVPGTAVETAPATTATVVDRPDGAVADLTEQLSGGNGVFIGSPEGVRADGAYGYEFGEPGYVQEEYVAAGRASSYVAEGELTPDGEWTLSEDQAADYRTRVLVRRPQDAEDFSGVVVVEWLNVSGGIDADPDWTSLKEEIIREGHAWVGVSAQLIGVEGGPVRVKVDVPGAEVAGQGLKTIDPARYASLVHPGDAFAYDIYSQVARALREGEGLDGTTPTTIIAAGESQSAGAMVTYINGVQPQTEAFDAFFVHSRGASGLPLAEIGESVDIASSIGRSPTILRTDTSVPIMNVQTENDLTGPLQSIKARQPDSPTFRLWEVAGTSHADAHLVGEATVGLIDCGLPINDAPMHVVTKAALAQLVDWIDTGEPPPEVPRLAVTSGDEPQIERDADGIALGGLRTPPVDVPVVVLSGEPGPGTDLICILAGSTSPMAPERLADLYPSRQDYEQRYQDAIDEAIADGHVLDADRAAMEAYAHPDLVSS